MPGADFYLSAFWELSTDRQIGMGYGPIPRAAIRSCAADEGITDEAEYECFRRCIRAMDSGWLEVANRSDDKSRVSDQPMPDEHFFAMF